MAQKVTPRPSPLLMAREAEQLMWSAVTTEEAFRAGQELFPGHRVLVVRKEAGTALGAD